MSDPASHHRPTIKRTFIGLAVVATVAGASYGIAGASIPDGAGDVHACYPTSASLKPVYFVDSATTSCPAGFSFAAVG